MLSLLSSDCHFESLALQGSFRGNQVARKASKPISHLLYSLLSLSFLLLHSPSEPTGAH